MKRSSVFIFPLVGAMIGSMLLTSCKKNSIQFSGTYPGTLTYTNTTTSPDTVTISAGSSSSNIIIHDSHLNLTLDGTVNSSYITIGGQTGSIGGVTDTISGTGQVAGSNLAVYLDTNSGGIAAPYTQFNGKRE